MTLDHDTILSVPNRHGAAPLMVKLSLDVDRPDLSGLDELLSPGPLDDVARAVMAADQPYHWAAQHVHHAIEHLKAEEFLHAWPPLVTGVEGLYWAEAEQRGFIDADRRFTAKSGRSDRPRSAIDIILVLPINKRVQRFLKRSAFGGEANAFRHGGLDPIGPREQCLMWLLALVAWIDGWGWPRPGES